MTYPDAKQRKQSFTEELSQERQVELQGSQISIGDAPFMQKLEGHNDLCMHFPNEIYNKVKEI